MLVFDFSTRVVVFNTIEIALKTELEVEVQILNGGTFFVANTRMRCFPPRDPQYIDHTVGN